MVHRMNLTNIEPYHYYLSFPKYLKSYLILEWKNLSLNVAFYMIVNLVLDLVDPQVWLY